MKHILFSLTLIFSGSIYAEDYFLDFEKECSTTGNKLNFKCKDSTKDRVLIFTESKKWYGKNPESGSVWELGIVKSDKYILVLNNPVLFSGTSVIHLMASTGKFYWSEFAYSDILNESEGTIRYGSFTRVHK